MKKILNFKKFFFFILILMMLTAVEANNASVDSTPLKTSSLNIENGRIVYDEIGSGNKIILLHGIFASKEQWTTFAKLLAHNGFTVIIPDLPGYGKSTGFPEKYYAIDEQVELLNQFVTKLNLKKLNIAGNSMGGLVAAKYVEKYPGKASTLAFIGSPLGLKSPKPSKIDEILSSGRNPFIPLTEEDFCEEMKLLFSSPPQFSNEQIQKRLARYQQEKDKDLHIWNLVERDKLALSHPIKISTPTLIIWGENDHIFDVSGAEILAKNITDSELITIKNGSHLLFMEEPKKSQQTT